MAWGDFMVVCEALLITLIVMMGIYVTITDLKSGLIENKAIIIASLIGVIINIIYFHFLDIGFLKIYLVNLLCISVLSILLYAFHFWAAGDSKMMICATMLFPARFYDYNQGGYMPGVIYIILIFLVAFVFILAESVYLTIKKVRFFGNKPKNIKKSILLFLKDYAISLLYLRCFAGVLQFINMEEYIRYQLFIAFICLFISVCIHNYSFFKKWYSIVAVLIMNIIFIVINKQEIGIYSVYSMVILLFVLILRFFLNGYNYTEIEVSDLKPGMILSTQTILGFAPSKIKGLPDSTFEDMRSRLTQDEVDSIKRWKDSKYGCEKVVIVRKLPFAVFIFLGMIVFFIIRIV